MNEETVRLTEYDQLKHEWLSAYNRLCRRPKPSKRLAERELIITPYEGCYGVAGYVLCLEGSPPVATVIIEGDHRPGRLGRLAVFDDMKTRQYFPSRFAPGSKAAPVLLWAASRKLLYKYNEGSDDEVGDE